MIDKKTFWLLSLTWGLPMTLFGAIVALALLVTGHKPKKYHYSIYFEVGRGWGGFECGAFFVVCKDNGESLKRHEAGHGIQNCFLGVFTPFLVSIPSAIRYWYRRWIIKNNPQKAKTLPTYDSIWFEKQATELGQRYFLNGDDNR